MKKTLGFLLVLASCVQPEVQAPKVEVIAPKKGVDKEKIFAIVKASKCATYRWKDRGIAPIGYMKGMALVYAKNFCKPLKTIHSGKYGALNWYGKERTLRNLFTLQIGLGLRESSGKFCCGIDHSSSRWKAYASGTSIDAKSALGVEAGTFQTSYNAAASVEINGNKAAAAEMRGLLGVYTKDSSECFLDVFKEGVKCSEANLANYGSGVGLEYQKLSKSCPTFHVEFTALTLQNSYKHYGPIITKAAEFRPECEQMLADVEKVSCK